MKVYIPSYNRAGEVSSHKLFKDADVKIVIPQSQEEAYREFYEAEELLVIEDRLDGSVGKKRNAILDIMKREDGCGIIVDDDMKQIRRIKDKKILSPKEITELFANLLEMANDIGAKYVGLNNTDDRLKYRGEFNPFSLTKPFYGIVGVIESGIRYDTSLIRGEDVDFYYRQLKKYHKVLRDNRYKADFNEKNKNTGIGKVDAECIGHFKALQKRYGKKLVRLNDDGTMKGVSQVYKGA